MVENDIIIGIIYILAVMQTVIYIVYLPMLLTLGNRNISYVKPGDTFTMLNMPQSYSRAESNEYDATS